MVLFPQTVLALGLGLLGVAGIAFLGRMASCFFPEALSFFQRNRCPIDLNQKKRRGSKERDPKRYGCCTV